MQSDVKLGRKSNAVFDLCLDRLISGKVRGTCLSHSGNVLLLIDSYCKTLVDVSAAKIGLANQCATGVENRDKCIAVTAVICGAVIGGTCGRKQELSEKG